MSKSSRTSSWPFDLPKTFSTLETLRRSGVAISRLWKSMANHALHPTPHGGGIVTPRGAGER
jgi:hypothetical protein